MINFMGKTLDNPLIASSCIATENVESVLRLARNGVQGAILKSCADYVRGSFVGKREFASDEKGFTYASSPFEMEIMTLGEEIALLRELRAQTDILLIPSLTASTLDVNDWLPQCLRLASEGADGIQLDFFYMGNLIGQEHFADNLTALLGELVKSVPCPVMPKLNVNLPKDFIMPLLKKSGVEYVSLLDSVRSPYLKRTANGFRLSRRLDARTTSCFGGWQLPLTLGYALTAAEHGLRVCAGGGITCADDVSKLLAVGAETVQSATFLTRSPEKVGELIPDGKTGVPSGTDVQDEDTTVVCMYFFYISSLYPSEMIMLFRDNAS